ncbi:MAG: oligosaccharide repeat unit polymerase [Kofleriaceae bacterium]|nr:MAG: oligosaccharide repeat unit polymerase [Kofleriaceae bacterium]
MADTGANPFVAIGRRQRVAIIAVFAIYLVLIAVARTQDPTPTVDWIPAALLLLIALTVAPFFFLRKTLGWFHPLVFGAFLRLVDLLRRFDMYSWGLDWHRALPLKNDELSDLIELQLLLYSLSVAAMYLGYFLGPKIPVPRLRFVEPRYLVSRLLIVFGVAFLAFVFYIARQGGLSSHIGTWAGGRHGQIAGQHYQFMLVQLGIPACWVWLAFRRSAIRSPLFWAAALVTLAQSFLLTGSRGTGVYAVVVGLIIWMIRERRVSYVRVIALGVVALYALTVLGSFRRSGWYGEPTWDSATDSSFVDTVVGGAKGELAERSTNADGALPILAKVPDEVPLLWGSSYVAILTLPIPRGLFPEKPTMVDGRVGRVFFHVDAGVPAGGVGEAYWNFHIPGVFAVYFLFGIFQRWLARGFLRNPTQPAVIAMYASAILLFREPSGLLLVQWLLVQVPLLAILIGVGALRFGSAPSRLPMIVPK